MEANNLQGAEFKPLVLRMLNKLRGKTDELRENFNSIKEEMETIKKNHSEMKAALTEMKNNLQGINCRVDEAENQNSDVEYKEARNNF